MNSSNFEPLQNQMHMTSRETCLIRWLFEPSHHTPRKIIKGFWKSHISFRAFHITSRIEETWNCQTYSMTWVFYKWPCNHYQVRIHFRTSPAVSRVCTLYHNISHDIFVSIIVTIVTPLLMSHVWNLKRFWLVDRLLWYIRYFSCINRNCNFRSIKSRI